MPARLLSIADAAVSTIGRAKGGRDGERRCSYGAALLAVALAALLRAALAPVLGTHYPLGTFYVAVALVGWFWGVKPAVLAALLGYPLGDALFLSPSVLEPRLQGLELCVYAAICSGLIAFVYRVFERQRQLDRALDAQALAQQAIAAKASRSSGPGDARFQRAPLPERQRSLRFRHVECGRAAAG